MKKVFNKSEIEQAVDLVNDILRYDVLHILNSQFKLLDELTQKSDNISVAELKNILNNKSSVNALVQDCVCVLKQFSDQNSLSENEFNLNKEIESAIIKLNSELERNNQNFSLIYNYIDEDIFLKGDEIVVQTVIYNLFYLAFGNFSNNKVEFFYSFESGFATISMKYKGDKHQIIDNVNFDNNTSIHNSQNSQISNSYLILKTLEKLGVGLISYSGQDDQNVINFTLHLNANSIKIENKFSSHTDEISRNSDWSDKTVLIVDDIEVNFFFIDTILSETNVKTIYAENGKIAVDICHDNKEIDAVLMDIKMPVMDGIEATKIIKSFNPELPVIMLTAYSFNEEKQKSIQTGCNDFLTKPLKGEDVIDVLAKYLK